MPNLVFKFKWCVQFANFNDIEMKPSSLGFALFLWWMWRNTVATTLGLGSIKTVSHMSNFLPWVWLGTLSGSWMLQELLLKYRFLSLYALWSHYQNSKSIMLYMYGYYRYLNVVSYKTNENFVFWSHSDLICVTKNTIPIEKSTENLQIKKI